jgi:hypothetical protein
MKKSLNFLCNLGKVKKNNKEIKNKQKMEIEEEKSVKSLAIEFLEKWDIKYTIERYESVEFIIFKCQGGQFLIEFCKDAPYYYRLVMPFIYKIDNDRIKVLEAMVNLMGVISYTKAFLMQDEVYLIIESNIEPNSNIDFFENKIRCDFVQLFKSQRKFMELLKE